MEVLIVDDYVEMATIIEDGLKHYGGNSVHCTIAPNYDAAKDAVSVMKYDVLMVDVDLGNGKTGIDFALEYQYDEPATKIIVYTGLDSLEPTDIKGLGDLKYYKFIRKPFHMDEFFHDLTNSILNMNALPKGKKQDTKMIKLQMDQAATDARQDTEIINTKDALETLTKDVKNGFMCVYAKIDAQFSKFVKTIGLFFLLMTLILSALGVFLK